MTPSFRPCWKPSPMHIPVVSSIQKRSSSSLCVSYFWAIWNTEGEKFIAPFRRHRRRFKRGGQLDQRVVGKHAGKVTVDLQLLQSPTCCLATGDLQSTDGPAGWGGLKGGRPGWDGKWFNVGMRCETAPSVGIYLLNVGVESLLGEDSDIIESHLSALHEKYCSLCREKVQIYRRNERSQGAKVAWRPTNHKAVVFFHTSHSIPDIQHA